MLTHGGFFDPALPWEGRCQPSGTARTLLKIAAQNPAAIRAAA
jgi:hypothetical protein